MNCNSSDPRSIFFDITHKLRFPDGYDVEEQLSAAIGAMQAAQPPPPAPTPAPAPALAPASVSASSSSASDITSLIEEMESMGFGTASIMAGLKAGKTESQELVDWMLANDGGNAAGAGAGASGSYGGGSGSGGSYS